ncbi:MAG: hypothetical protein FJW80_00805 [Actinobacteria bacterium]|nr:hypothetical protein [Actinomycetota bacterium]
MTDQTPQDPQERLAAVDPAASAPDPDIAAIRAKVLAAPTTNVVPLRRRRTAYVIGAVAAGVCLLAGTTVAGAAVGRVTAPQTDTVTAAVPTPQESLPVIGAAPNSPQMAAVGAQNAGGAPMGAPEAMSSQPADAKMAIWPGWGSTFEPDPSLPNESGTATGYRLTSEGIDAAALAAQLAKAFGIKGEPREENGSIVVGPSDGTGPMIYVANDALVSWSYYDPTKNPWNCGVTPLPEPAPAEASGSAGSVDPGAPEVAECEPTKEAVSEQDAVRAARKILSTIGVSEDPATGIDIEWEAGTDGITTWATAWQRVGGNRTQLSWSFTFDHKDVLWANGFAAGLEPVPAYPIVGAFTAVLRSQDPRFTVFGPTPLDYGGVVPMAKARGTVAGSAVSSDTVVSPSTSDTPSVPAGDPGKVQVWWDPITVTGAEPTLAQYWQSDGTLLILPAYRLITADDRGTWAVIAVDESAVQWVNPNAG